jgi:hypothetical protein
MATCWEYDRQNNDPQRGPHPTPQNLWIFNLNAKRDFTDTVTDFEIHDPGLSHGINLIRWVLERLPFLLEREIERHTKKCHNTGRVREMQDS